jgi:hypothetical protein
LPDRLPSAAKRRSDRRRAGQDLPGGWLALG